MGLAPIMQTGTLRFPEETQWDQPAEASVPAVSALCVTDVAPSHQLALGLWRASLAVGHGVPAWWGSGQAPGDRVLHAMPALSVATKSQQVPAGCASLRDALWDPSWPCGGAVAGAFVEMVLEKEH